METNPTDTLLAELARELGIDEDTLKSNRFFTLVKGVFPVYIMNLTRKLAPYGGEIDDNYATVTLGNNDTVSQTVTVPAGKRWYLFGGRMSNGDNVVRNVTLQVYNELDVAIAMLIRYQVLAAGGEIFFPNTEAVSTQLGSGAYPLPLLAGWDLEYTWNAGGVSAGGTSHISAIVVEVDE